MSISIPQYDLMTPKEVGEVFRVDAKTVTRWSKAGLIPAIRTLGGHRRFRRDDVMRLLEESKETATEHSFD